MLNSGIFDAVIGVLFMFLLVATICTSVREGVEAFLGWRARYLEFAIYQLLRDRMPKDASPDTPDEGTSTLARDFFEHPLIFGLYKGTYAFPDRMKKPKLLSLRPNLPSYIPSKAFARAVLDVVVRQAGNVPTRQAGKIQLDELREVVGQLSESPQVQRAVLSAIDSSEGSLESVRVNLEAWFDGAMDRVSGWYKRSTQLAIFIIAAAFVIALNIDTLVIAERLYQDDALRATVLAAAERTTSLPTYEQAKLDLQQLELPIGWHEPAAPAKKLPAQQKPAFQGPSEARAAAQPAGHDVAHVGLAGGLASARPSTSASIQGTAGSLVKTSDHKQIGWVKKLAGLSITIFAATLGAPFWFDLLKKVMVIRSTVKPREKSREEGSEHGR